DCGKTFVSVNLAVALSRYENCRTVLMDMDMRNPSVAKTLGLRDVGSMGAYLRGEIETRDQFFKFDQNDMSLGDNLAIAMNDRVEPFASELMQQPATRDRLTRMEAELHPDVVLFDLPPALANDDVIAFKSNFDGVLIVIDGTRTSGAEVREVMRRLGEDVPLLGVVLNKAEDATGDEYGY
ncbi:MAG: P-loop NTPase, partial [Pseudomonadota bacterium]|nr:P-loop NTPase [Pseudomonadota bacterium]